MDEQLQLQMDNRNIGKLAQFMGVSPYTIKYYEKIGLLSANRDKQSNYRRYELSTCSFIAECLKYRKMGFSLKELEVLIKQADEQMHQSMLEQRLLTVEEELQQLNELHRFLLQYRQDCQEAEKNLEDWYIVPFKERIYCRPQTNCLNFTEKNISEDSINIMDYAPRTQGIVILSQSYLNGGKQEFSWGQSVTFQEPHPELEACPEFDVVAPVRAFVAYRKYSGSYVINGEMAQDIRAIFHQYAPEFPCDVYAVRLKIVHDSQGKDWNYFKIIVPLE